MLAILALFMFAGCGEPEQTVVEENVVTQQNEAIVENDGNMDSNENLSIPTQQEFDEYLASQQEVPDVKNCDSVSNTELKQRCLDDNLRGLAVLNLDKTYCDQLSSKERQESCNLAVERRLN